MFEEERFLKSKGPTDLFLQVFCVLHCKINPFFPLYSVTGIILKHRFVYIYFF